jgi:hypothetical protein
MIIPETGGILKVVGNRIAMAPVGPIPGKTPIRVPIKTPMKQYKMFAGMRATENP